jgi:hypothetical protein
MALEGPVVIPVTSRALRGMGLPSPLGAAVCSATLSVDGCGWTQTPPGTTYIDTPVTSGERYQFTLTAYDGSEVLAAASTTVTALVVPLTLTANVSPGTITLSWNGDLGASYYVLVKYLLPINYAGPPQSTWTLTGTSYPDISVTAGASYYYGITAFDSSGNDLGEAWVNSVTAE